MRSFLLCLCMFSTAVAAEVSAPKSEDPIMARSLFSAGETARVQRVLAKGRRGEPVTVAVIGGSITAGASASSPDKNYGGQLARWWRETFPKSKIEFVNAGIGATGSNYGALRAQRDLLDRREAFPQGSQGDPVVIFDQRRHAAASGVKAQPTAGRE